MCRATKCRLRGLSDLEELLEYLQPTTVETIAGSPNHPTAILCILSEYFRGHYANRLMEAPVYAACEMQLSEVQQAVNECERIIMTPVPFPYVVQIRQILTLYLFSLPVVLHHTYNAYIVSFVTFFISYSLFGVEQVPALIENPFGEDECDLPLAQFIQTVNLGMASFIDMRRVGCDKSVHHPERGSINAGSGGGGPSVTLMP